MPQVILKMLLVIEWPTQRLDANTRHVADSQHFDAETWRSGDMRTALLYVRLIA